MKRQSKKTTSKKNDDRLSSISSIVVDTKKRSSKTQKNAESSASNENDEPTYRIAPKGILFLALSKVFGKKVITLDKLDEFTEILLKDLSRLASNGEKTELFGSDFNDFFSMFVETMNLCGMMKQKLDENGIEFDPHEADGSQDNSEED